MAVTQFSLTSGNAHSTNDQNTASVTPTANRLILITMASNNGLDSAPATPAVTGNGITYTLLDSFVMNTRKRISVWRGMSASPTAGVINFQFSGNTQYAMHWSVMEFGGDVDTSGTNGSGAIGLSGSATATDTTVSVSLGSLSAGSATYGACYANDASDQNETFTAGSGYTAIHSMTGLDFFFGAMTEWRADGQSAVDFSLSASRTLRVMGYEIKGVGGIAYSLPLAGEAYSHTGFDMALTYRGPQLALRHTT